MAMAKLKTIFEFHDRITRRLLRPTKAVTKMKEATEKADRAARKLAKAKAAPKITVSDRATPELERIRRKTEKLGGTTAAPTVKVDDKASASIDNINGKLDRMKGVVLGIAAAAGITGGGLMFAGQSAFEMDARAAAVTNMEPAYITPAVQSIYYDNYAGTSREGVLESLLKIGQQTDLQGNDLTAAALTSSQINSLIPTTDPREITRAQSAMYNAMGASFERTADNMMYIYRNAGDQYEDLFDTFNEYATTFDKLQISPEQLASGLVAGQQAGGFNYDVLADSLREWGIKSLNEMNDDVLGAYEKLFGRTKTWNMYESLKSGDLSGADFLAQVMKEYSKLNPMVQNKIGANIFGTKFEDNHQAIIDFANGLSTAAETTGELNRQFEQLRASPITPINDTLRNMRGLLEDTGQSILVGVAPAFDRLNQWMLSPEGQKSVANFADAVTKLAVALGEGLAQGIQWTIENIDWLIPTVGALLATFAGLFAFVKGAKLFKALQPLFKGIAGLARGKAGSGGGLAGLLQKIIKVPWLTKIGQFIDVGWTFATRVLGFLGTALRWVGRAFGWVLKFLQPLLPWLGRIIGWGLRFLPVIGWVISAVLAVWSAWKNWDKIKAFLQPFFDWVGDRFTGVKQWLSDVGDWLGNVYDDWLTWDGIKEQLSGLFTWFGEKFDWLADKLAFVGDKIKKFKDDFNQIKSGNFEIGMPKWMGGKGIIQIGGADGVHERGISDIPFDGYRAILHKGETVLPAAEASLLRQMAASQGDQGDGNGKGLAVEIGVPKWLGGKGLFRAGGADGSHARGISNIPFDGYRAILHKGETVLPAAEASLLRQMAASQGDQGDGNGKGLAVEIGVPKWLGGKGLFQIGGADGSHARGISNIPFDGYRAILHKGETVLPAAEASLLRQMAASRGSRGGRGNVSVTFSGDQHFHNGSDEDSLVRKVVAAIGQLLDDEEDTGPKGVYA